MGPVRHRHLINWLSLAVALQLSVALVALSARAGRDIGPRAKAESTVGKAQNVSILAGTEIAKRRDARADIVRAGAVYGPGGVTFALQVQRPADLRTDERWASDSTYAQWEVDTNGDSLPDFEVQYHVVKENLGGSVSKPGDGGEPVCGINAGTYSAEGYKITVDPACLGNPEAFSYRAAVYYDSNPSDDNADVVTDAAPDGGWSSSISRPS